MRVVADTHAALWNANGSERLTATARLALVIAEDEPGGIVVSAATLIDLWYVTQTTHGVSSVALDRLRTGMLSSPAIELHPVDVAVADAYVGIDRALISDPWDRLIVATAVVLEAPLVTRDEAIRAQVWSRSSGKGGLAAHGLRTC